MVMKILNSFIAVMYADLFGFYNIQKYANVMIVKKEQIPSKVDSYISFITGSYIDVESNSKLLNYRQVAGVLRCATQIRRVTKERNQSPLLLNGR